MFGLLVLQVGKQHGDLGYCKKRLIKECAFWVEKTGQEPIQTKFEVCRLVIIRFYSLLPSDFESQEVDTLH